MRRLILAMLIVCSTSCISFNTLSAQKTVGIHVDARNHITIDGIDPATDDLAKEVQQRLWRSYMSNGKMVHSITVQMDTTVKEETKNEVLFAVKTAQEKTLTVLSLHKYKKRFEDIGGKKQEKIKKQFPVLFQREYGDTTASIKSE